MNVNTGFIVVLVQSISAILGTVDGAENMLQKAIDLGTANKGYFKG